MAEKPENFNSNEFEPKVASFPVAAPKLKSIVKRDKFNSTATIFMTNSIKSADVCEIIFCLSRALAGLIKKHEENKTPKFSDIFSEEVHPLGDGNTNLVTSPNFEQVLEFLKLLFEGQDLSAECGVMAAAYIERLLSLTGITIHASNWRRIMLGALLLSSKVWEDLAVWNIDFLASFPKLTVQDLNRLEWEYLSSLSFSVSLSATVYAKYYFQLRSLSDTSEQFFPLQPLDTKTAAKIEARSLGLEETAKIKHIHSQRSFSLNPYETAGTVSLEQLQSKLGKNWRGEED
jgi:hypothetical protein